MQCCHANHWYKYFVVGLILYILATAFESLLVLYLLLLHLKLLWCATALDVIVAAVASLAVIWNDWCHNKIWEIELLSNKIKNIDTYTYIHTNLNF